ncbi:hypothetical protein [Methylobacter psychrophilus]|uniref:hypothetical protein n=1 Tax=Methylobacter psychrophilus TaxID=96941 RepID=UPI0021D491AA|nr:hypothetical protein [Methylobacter psychrophilus]
MNLNESQLKEIEEKVKKSMCFHEVGHHVIYSCFGGVGEIEIRRIPLSIPRDWDNERLFSGRCKMFIEPGQTNYSDDVKSRLRMLPVPENWRVLVGLAGLVAEYIAEYIADGEADEIDAWVIAERIGNAIEMDEMSETDLALAGDDWGEPEVESVLKILLDRWEDVEQQVKWELQKLEFADMEDIAF